MTGVLESGVTFAGYRIEGVVARGGMGVVYRATDLSLDRPVALKLIAPEVAQDEAFRRRFLKEPRMAAALDHPNVVPIYEAREHDGRLYLAMRFVPGQDLATRLRERRLSPEEAVAVLAPVADALDAAHRRGLVHRDVKPANILLHEDGRPYLTDFGITKEVGSGSTATGQLVGTLAYLAPEAIRGERVDGRSDQYALACVLHECVTGAPPFGGRSEAELLWAHMQNDPPVPAGHPELGPVLARAMAKDPAARYESCTALVDAARAVLLPDVPAPPASRGRRRAPRIRPRLLVAGGVLLLAAGVAAAVLAGDDRRAEPEPTGGQILALDAVTGKVEERFAAGRVPLSVAIDGGTVWAVDAEGRTLLRIAAADGATDVLATGATPVSVAPAGDAVWVANGRQRPDSPGFGAVVDEVVRLDARTGVTEATVPLPSSQSADAEVDNRLALSRSAAWVITAAGAVARIDRASAAITATTPEMGTDAVAAGPAGVWAIDGSGRAVELDERTGRIVRRQRLPAEDAESLAVGDGAVWVTSFTEGRLWRVGRPGDVVGAVEVGEGASDIAVARGRVWVANPLAGTLVAVDPATMTVVRTVQLGGAPRSVGAADGRVWVALTGEAAPASSEVTGITPLPASQCGAVVGGEDGRADALIVSDLPLQGDTRLTARQMAQAITFVLRERGFRAGRLRLAYQSCDDALAATGTSDAAKCAANGRAYARNLDVLAVIGTFHSGCAEVMLPELNRAPGGPLGMVSPLNSYIGLTREVPPGQPGPSRFYPTGRRSFVRVYPADDLQGSALAQLARDRGRRRVFVLDDGYEGYSDVVAAAFEHAAGRLGVEIAGRERWEPGARRLRALARRVAAARPDAVLLSGLRFENDGGRLVRELRARLAHDVDLYASDGFGPPSELLTDAGKASRGMLLGYNGLVIDRLPAGGERFVERFARTQPGVPVESFAVYAAAATEVLLEALERSDGTRGSAIEELFRTRVRGGVIGDLAFDERGDVVPAPVTILRVTGRGRSANFASTEGATVERVVLVAPELVPGG